MLLLLLLLGRAWQSSLHASNEMRSVPWKERPISLNKYMHSEVMIDEVMMEEVTNELMNECMNECMRA